MSTDLLILGTNVLSLLEDAKLIVDQKQLIESQALNLCQLIINSKNIGYIKYQNNIYEENIKILENKNYRISKDGDYIKIEWNTPKVFKY